MDATNEAFPGWPLPDPFEGAEPEGTSAVGLDALAAEWSELADGEGNPRLMGAALEFMGPEPLCYREGERPPAMVEVYQGGVRRLMDGLGLTPTLIGEATAGELATTTVQRLFPEAAADDYRDPFDPFKGEDPFSISDVREPARPARMKLKNARNLAAVLLCAACISDGTTVARLGEPPFGGMGKAARGAVDQWRRALGFAAPDWSDTRAEEPGTEASRLRFMIDNWLTEEQCRTLRIHALGMVLEDGKVTEAELYGLTGYYYGH